MRNLDLTEQGAALRTLDVSGALFLGCRLRTQDDVSVRARGAIVFPTIPDVPVDMYRTTLYSPEELYCSEDYSRSLDARVYAWSQITDSRETALAQTLHDHSIELALRDWLRGRCLVGVMGGHAAERGTSAYGDAARVGWLLSQHLTVATGGGPGAMEAVNLGGYAAGHPEEALKQALDALSAVPSFSPSVDEWARTAFSVRASLPGGAESLGIPTWHYGHEPPNAFASAIAKHFRNAQREAILLEICQDGILFLPGAAGTVQEIFQDGCENYYADESSTAPMILVGREYWTDTYPAWPLLQALARGRAMESHVHLVDSVDEAAALVRGA